MNLSKGRRHGLVATFAAAAVLALDGVSPALATTGAGSENPDVIVSLSVGSQGTPNPDIATVGDKVGVVVSVNNKPLTLDLRAKEFRIRVVLQDPLGKAVPVSFPVTLLPGQKLDLPFDFAVSTLFPKGKYVLTLEAIEVGDPAAPPSSATASLTIV